MITRALIVLPSQSAYAPAAIGPFLIMPEHGCHVWKGRELDAGEFNAVVGSVLAEAQAIGVQASVRLLEFPEPEPDAPKPKPSPGFVETAKQKTLSKKF